MSLFSDFFEVLDRWMHARIKVEGDVTVEITSLDPERAPLTEQEVRQKLTALARAAPEKSLEPLTSIVDLLKVLRLPSDFEYRKQWAKEEGYQNDLNKDSAALNIWLHNVVVEQVRHRGIPLPVLS